MDLSAIGVVTVALGALILFLHPAFGICALVVSTLFGSAAAVTLSGFGGIQPTHLLLGFVVVRALMEAGGAARLLQQVRFGSCGWWLLATLLYGGVATVFLPRIFAGEVFVNPIRAQGLVAGAGALPLGPTAGNITQLVYFLGDTVCFVVISAFARERRQALLVGDFLLAYCTANAALALADLVCARTNTSFLLDFMRNANYAIFDDLAGPDLYRLKGSFTEASAFAYATIGAFCFTMRLYLAGVRRSLSGTLALLSLTFLLLSTSSTAYVALAPCLAFLVVGAVLRLLQGRASRQDVGLVLVWPLLTLGGVLVILVVPELRVAVGDMLDAFVLNKAASQSGLDRAALNMSGLQAFVATYGLGTGIGSVRASSFVVAAVANLGLVGSILYGMFLAALLLPAGEDASPRLADLRSAARCGVAGSLVAAAISGALIDLGLAFFAMAALASTPMGRARASSREPSSLGVWISARPASADRPTCP